MKKLTMTKNLIVCKGSNVDEEVEKEEYRGSYWYKFSIQKNTSTQRRTAFPLDLLHGSFLNKSGHSWDASLFFGGECQEPVLEGRARGNDSIDLATDGRTRKSIFPSS